MKWTRKNKTSENDVFKVRRKERKYVSDSCLDPIPEKINSKPQYMQAAYSSPRSGDLVPGNQLLLSRSSTVVPQLLKNKSLNEIKLPDFPDKEFPKKKSFPDLPFVSIFDSLKSMMVGWWTFCSTCKCNFHLLFSKDFWRNSFSSTYKKTVSAL